MTQDEINLALLHCIRVGRITPDAVDTLLLPSYLRSAVQAMQVQIGRGASFPLRLRDTWTIASTQFGASPEVEPLLKDLQRVTYSDEVLQSIAESAALRRVIESASLQLQTGDYDVTKLRSVLDVKNRSEQYVFSSDTLPSSEEVAERLRPTGIRNLDHVIGGFKYELIIVAARPKTGKSTFFFNLIRAGVERKICYFTFADYDRYDLREIWERDFPDLLRSKTLTVVDYTAFAAKVPDIEGVVDTIKPDLVIVDRAEEMVSGSDQASRRYELGDLVIRLRRLAKKYQCPVVIDGQLSDEAENAISRGRNLTFSHLAEDRTRRASLLDLFIGLQRTHNGLTLHVAGRRPGLPCRVTVATDRKGRYL